MDSLLQSLTAANFRAEKARYQFSIDDMVRVMDPPMSEQTISMYLSGSRPLSIQAARRIGQALDELIEREIGDRPFMGVQE